MTSSVRTLSRKEDSAAKAMEDCINDTSSQVSNTSSRNDIGATGTTENRVKTATEDESPNPRDFAQGNR